MLLSVLKYIGIVILFLLALLLTAACVLLFCPISYKAAAKSPDARLVVKWLLGSVKLKLEYMEKNLSFDFLIFGRKRKPGTGKKTAKPKPSRKKLEKSQDETTEDVKIPPKQDETDKDVKIPPKQAEPDEDIKTLPKQDETDKDAKTRLKQDQPDNNKASGSTKSRKGKYKKAPGENRLKKIIGLVKSFINYPDRKVIVKKTLLLLKRLFRPFKPSKFALNGEVGFGSPDITGKFLAAESLFVCFTGLPVNIKGNFEQKYLNLNFSANGRFCLFSLLWPLALYVFSKPVWKIIRNYLKNKEENNE